LCLADEFLNFRLGLVDTLLNVPGKFAMMLTVLHRFLVPHPMNDERFARVRGFNQSEDVAEQERLRRGLDAESILAGYAMGIEPIYDLLSNSVNGRVTRRVVGTRCVSEDFKNRFLVRHRGS